MRKNAVDCRGLRLVASSVRPRAFTYSIAHRMAWHETFAIAKTNGHQRPEEVSPA